MFDFTDPADRRTFVLLLQEHAVHIARFATTLPNDLPTQIAGSNLVSSSAQALQLARRFLQEPTQERIDAVGELLEQQYTWLDLLGSAELMQEPLLRPHLERISDILAASLNRTP